MSSQRAVAAGRRLRGVFGTLWLAVAVIVLGRGVSLACTGTACMEIWSTADGGGALTVYWDYTKPVQTYLTLCAGGQCLYSNNDPGFMAPPADTPPAAGLYRLVDGTEVGIQIISIDDGFVMNVNGVNLMNAGDTQLLGTMPTIHVHPIWKILAADGQFGDYHVSYKLTTSSAGYTDSEVYQQTITNIQPIDPTPTPTPTVAPSSGCTGDCDGNNMVAVNELVMCVNIALGNADLSTCNACDTDGDRKVAVNELVSAVDASLNGCAPPPTVTFDELQTTIFTPTCAMQFCHDVASHNENLTLAEGDAYSNLVNVQSVESSLLRVAPGDPTNSFLIVKLTGPPLGQGAQMPSGLPPLSASQIQMIRNWILQGAKP
ncbi:MAG TPA: hypothetical protein VL403_15835 [Candidatus Kryptonia bacterium]|nr:hypothetical protein [Candidatus Kryptonia bacterium]